MPAVRLVRRLLLLAVFTATSSPGYAQQPRGALAGVVRDTAGFPLQLVTVTAAAPTPHTAFTDSAGAFALADVPAGLLRVAFRRIGFAPAQFTLLIEPGDTSHVVVELTAVSFELDTIRVAGENVHRELEVAGFYERMRQAREGAGVGRFLTPEEVDQLRNLRLTTHILEAAGVRTMSNAFPVGSSNIVLNGALRSFLTGPCQMALFVDGNEIDAGTYYHDPSRRRAEPGGINAFVHPREILAIEIYQSASGTPQRFQSVHSALCGSIVIWTLAGPRDRQAVR